MSMSLTADDLKAVKQLIDDSIDERVPKIIDERVPKIISERVPAIIASQVPGIMDSRVQPMLNKLEKRLTRKIDGLRLDVGKFSLETTNNFNKLDKRVDNLSKRLEVVADMADYNRVETRKIKRKLGFI